MPAERAIAAAGREVVVTSLERVLYPDGFTKGDMIEYYRRLAPVLLPHVRGRPMTLRRFPEGVLGNPWFQTQCRGAPPWVATAAIPLPKDRVHDYCLIDDEASLLWAVNLNTIELHPFLRRVPRLAEPVELMLDLDPGPPAGLAECCAVALRLRDALEADSLRGFPKTSGGSGLHVVVPLAGGHTFEQTKRFARDLAERFAREDPARVVAVAARMQRAGKVFVDWAQNDPLRSTIAPYSLRAGARPRVATPVTWQEVERGAGGDASGLVFTTAEVAARVERVGDLHAAMEVCPQSLPAPSER